MPDEQNPVEQIPLERVEKWGCPWHGLITDGALMANVPLPTVGTHAREVSPPPSDLESWDGSAWVVARPDMPVPATEADEAALGMEWRNYALLSGRCANLYGKNLAPESAPASGVFHWLALDDLGKWWHCALVATDDWTQSGGLSIEIEMHTFGEFGPPTGTQSFGAVHLTDIGQATPAIPLGGSFPTDITDGQIWVSDVLPTGTQLILGLRNSLADKETTVAFSSATFMYTAWDEHYHARFRQSLGFLLLDLRFSGGVADPVLSVIADRETTLGTLTVSHSGEFNQIWTVSCSNCGVDGQPANVRQSSNEGTDDTHFGAEVANRIIAMWFAEDPLHPGPIVPIPVLLTANYDSAHDDAFGGSFDACQGIVGVGSYGSSVNVTTTKNVSLAFGDESALMHEAVTTVQTVTETLDESDSVSNQHLVRATEVSLTGMQGGTEDVADTTGPGAGGYDPGGVCDGRTDNVPATDIMPADEPVHRFIACSSSSPLDGKYHYFVGFLTPTLLSVIVLPVSINSTLYDGGYGPQIGPGGAHATTGAIAQTTPGSGIPKKVYGTHNPRENATAVAVDSRIGYV